jgi:predicted membrane channel-forming protein YqfA (hemolysin III family)
MTWLLKEEYINDIDFYKVQFQFTFSPILLSLGVVLFAQGGVPERFTGVLGLNKHFFDMIGHSHQCWHLCTAMVMFGLLDALVRHCELRSQKGCSL